MAEGESTGPRIATTVVEKSAPARVEAPPKVASQIDTRIDTSGVSTTHNALERLANPEDQLRLIDEVVRDGGVGMYASLPQHTDGRAGYGTEFKGLKTEDDQIGQKIFSLTGENNYATKTELQDAGVHEVLVATPLEGSHQDLVTEGRAEPAVALTYATIDNRTKPEHRDFSGRPASFGMQIVLPESTARAFLEQVQLDPSLLQRTIDAIAIQKFGIDEAAWKSGTQETEHIPLRPPYEQWGQQGGEGVRIQDRLVKEAPTATVEAPVASSAAPPAEDTPVVVTTAPSKAEPVTVTPPVREPSPSPVVVIPTTTEPLPTPTPAASAPDVLPEPVDLPTPTATVEPTTAEAPATADLDNEYQMKERRTEEVRTVAQTLILAEAKKQLIGPDGNPRVPGNHQEEALSTIQRLATEKNVNTLFGDGDPITLPGFEIPLAPGRVLVFETNDTNLAGIAGTTADNRLICFLRDVDGNLIDNTGNPIPGSSKLQTRQEVDRVKNKLLLVPLERNIVIDATIRSEKETLKNIFAGDDSKQRVIEKAVETLPQGGGAIELSDQLDSDIRTNAEAAGLMTTRAVTTLLEALPAEEKAKPEIQALLKQMEGKVVLDREGMKQAIKVLGGNREATRARIDELHAEIDKYAQRTDPASIRILRQAEAELEAIESVSQILEAPARNGRAPVDELIEAAQANGETTELFKAITSGDYAQTQGMIDNLINSQPGLNEEQKTEARSKMKALLENLGENKLKYGLIFLAIMAALVALGVVAAGYTGLQVGKGLGGSYQQN